MTSVRFTRDVPSNSERFEVDVKTKPDLQPAIDELLSGMECATIWRHEEPRHRSRSEVRRLVSGYVHAIRILRAAEVCK